GAGTAKSVPVKGKVTLDGQPLATGEISFEASDGTVPSTMKISNGAFSGDTTAGKKVVRISSFKESKPNTPAGGPDASKPSLENIIPARYNVNSTESRDVSASGPNDFTFDLKSKGMGFLNEMASGDEAGANDFILGPLPTPLLCLASSLQR